MKQQAGNLKKKKGFWYTLSRQLDLQAMTVPALICLVLFNFLPLLGLQIAFKDFKLNAGIWGSEWSGFESFAEIFSDPNMVNVMINTLGLSFIKAFVIFPLPIIFALLLHEVTFTPFKKIVQTVSYFPYFLAWSIVSLMAISWLSPQSGFVNGFLMAIGVLDKPYFFLGKAEAFWGISVSLDIWKNFGYSSIIYLAAMSGVDSEVVEAAVIDGAGRFRRMWHVTMPAILPTVMILLIINIGNLLRGGSNFDISYNLANSLNLERSEILDTYVLKVGITYSRFSFATAVGLLQGVVSAMLLLIANWFSKVFTGESYF